MDDSIRFNSSNPKSIGIVGFENENDGLSR